YDKRPYKYGFKMTIKGGITVREEAIEDAILAKKLLESDSRIDKNNIFIVGHSMGGMLAPRIDAEGGNFKGLIIMAGTLRTLKEVLEDQTAEMLGQMSGIMKWLTEKQVKKIMKGFDGLENLIDDEAKKRKFGNGVTMYYFKEMDSFPTAECLKNTEKPVLVMQGDKDFQCKAEVDFAGYKALLEGKENVTFRLYENLNHCFVPSVYGKITKAKQEYNKEQHIGENVIADIAGWIKGVI
ncbi:MAG: prolyl oligopeptidase family serine peptidase, partial [Clostridia bacterium]|nr:prolyl oligopeptidase family serine peptidase [Clostridia bacterium]